jgi:hypothetical protein
MYKSVTGFIRWNWYFRDAALAIVLLLLSFQPAFSATKPDRTIEITDGKEQFMRTLASMPYTSSGAGPVLYVLECSKCKSSQAFETDWKGQLDGVELRRFLIALNATAANETAYLARTRDINDFYAIMNQTKVAPPIKACNCPDDNKAIQAFNSVEKPLKTVLLPTIMKNGWSNGGPPPQFMWETNGRVYASGYFKGSVQEILNMLRSGTQTKEASVAPVKPPASDSASTRNDSSAAKTTDQLMTAEKNSPKLGRDTPASESGSQFGGSAGSGPDLVGLRIGMTPDEVRAIIKSRGWGPPAKPLNDYEEISKTLLFRDLSVGGGLVTAPVPNGTFLNGLKAGGVRGDGSTDHFNVVFTPVPGHERLISVQWHSGAADNKKPTFEVVENMMLAKYGRPTYSPPDPNAGWYYLWSYDSNGMLHPPGSMKGLDQSCAYGADPKEGLLTLPRQDPQFAQRPAKCGTIVRSVNIAFRAYTGRDTLVEGYVVNLMGFDALLPALDAAKGIIDKAQAESSAAQIKKGQQQKPEF